MAVINGEVPLAAISDSHAWSIDLNAFRRGDGSLIDRWARSRISASGRGEGIFVISVFRVFCICCVSFSGCDSDRRGVILTVLLPGESSEMDRIVSGLRCCLIGSSSFEDATASGSTGRSRDFRRRNRRFSVFESTG
uniref:(northern house mosquito) hypothetical protein n=1 Tax=Culex pipiens TaxID=7175 RepID=A0A8D8GY51_CULPI